MRTPVWVTILAGALALVFIIAGIVLLERIWRENGTLRVDINTAGVGALGADGLATPTPQPLLAGVESGSMALGGQQQEVIAFAAVLPADVPAPTEVPPPTEAPPTEAPPAEAPPAETPTPASLSVVDPCPPQAEAGFAADTPLAAVGMIRLYIEPDVLAPTLGEFSAGQTFLVTADTAGVTALRRCEVVWVRVRLTGGGMGWALASALQAAPTTAEPAPMPLVSPPICPGGCATPTCNPPCAEVPCGQPCIEPCNLPCTQPCTTPCGVYSK